MPPTSKNILPSIDFLTAVSMERYANFVNRPRYCFIPAFADTDGLTDVWDGPITGLTYDEVNVPIKLLSSSVNDTPAGSGALNAIVTLLKIDGSGDWVEQIHTVALNGTTAVTVDIAGATLEAVRILQIELTANNYGGSAAGNVTVQRTSDNSIMCQAIALATSSTEISPNRSRSSHYTIPDKLADGRRVKKAYIISLDTSASRNSGTSTRHTEYRLLTRDQLDKCFKECKFMGTSSGGDTSFSRSMKLPKGLDPRTDIKAMALAISVNINRGAVDYEILLELEKN